MTGVGLGIIPDLETIKEYIPASTILGNYLADTLLWNEYLVTLLNMLANFVLEFLYDRFFVFRKSIDTNHLVSEGAYS